VKRGRTLSPRPTAKVAHGGRRSGQTWPDFLVRTGVYGPAVDDYAESRLRVEEELERFRLEGQRSSDLDRLHELAVESTAENRAMAVWAGEPPELTLIRGD